MVSLPESARPRLVALETDSPPPLLELHRRLAHRLARTARERPGDRFRPHLTLCRFAPGSRPEPVDATADLEAFPVAELLVMRSTLRPQGAEHSAVERVALG
jgi:2'-5' RNA ligase